MDEYAGMLLMTDSDIVEDLYEPSIEGMAKVTAARQKAVEAASRARRAKGQETAKKVKSGDRKIVDKRQQRRILRGK